MHFTATSIFTAVITFPTWGTHEKSLAKTHFSPESAWIGVDRLCLVPGTFGCSCSVHPYLWLAYFFISYDNIFSLVTIKLGGLCSQTVFYRCSCTSLLWGILREPHSFTHTWNLFFLASSRQMPLRDSHELTIDFIIHILEIQKLTIEEVETCLGSHRLCLSFLTYKTLKNSIVFFIGVKYV